jgi:hypothetical protein
MVKPSRSVFHEQRIGVRFMREQPLRRFEKLPTDVNFDPKSFTGSTPAAFMSRLPFVKPFLESKVSIHDLVRLAHRKYSGVAVTS